MGVVTNYLQEIIAEQLKLHKLVVWYDPTGDYAELVENLSFPQVTIARYQGSFIGLRYEIDHLMEDNDPPRLLVYVPMAKEASGNALVELEAAGVMLKPGQQPPERNTRLSYIAVSALRPRLGQTRAADIERQVEAGQLNLVELDKLAEQEVVLTRGVLSVIFGTLNATEVALNFLDSTQYDEPITSRKAQEELAGLILQAFELELPANESLAAGRIRLARHVLLSEFISGLQGELPGALSSVKIARQPAALKACQDLAKRWRQQRSTNQSYQN